MRAIVTLVLAFSTAVAGRGGEASPDLVWIEGGTFLHSRSNFFRKGEIDNPYVGRLVTVAGFYLGRCEVTQREWLEVMGANPSRFRGDALPVENVSWYDCIAYCNARSVREGLTPCYTIDKARRDPGNENEIDDVKWIVTLHPGANGYRLPTEAEWEYAAEGGRACRNFTYSGGNELGAVAWFWQNAGDRPLGGSWNWPGIEQNHTRTHPVGTKQPNELGLHDMSGNVREWCWNWYADAPAFDTGPERSAGGRVWKGGGWMGGDFCCEPAFRSGFEASGRGADQGFRVCRNP